jgi:hypothetical protein
LDNRDIRYREELIEHGAQGDVAVEIFPKGSQCFCGWKWRRIASDSADTE